MNRSSPPASDSASDSASDYGPSPPAPTLPRGRGAYSSSSSSHRTNIDQRFADPSYDPHLDVQPDSEDDDWDTSLEALRDRAAWRTKGAQRLREAGFSESHVRKFESGGREKDERDVVWRGRGEGREWDVGKVLDRDGDVGVKAGWTKGL